jgi:hypothetical protein
MVVVMEAMAVATGVSNGPVTWWIKKAVACLLLAFPRGALPSVTQHFAQPCLELDAILLRSPKAKRLLSEAFLLSSKILLFADVGWASTTNGEINC